ncbi:MAG TPA: polysaccharide biosynthesis/export family protein [Myxococcota bacterium]|jgi:polysaccharide export outer membrane protein
MRGLQVGFVVVAVFAFGGATCGARPLDELPKVGDTTREALAVGDLVDVQVFNEPDLSGPHQIGAGGMMRLPLVGDVVAAGMTLEALQTEIQAAYNAKYLKNGQVSIKLVESTTLTVYVLGEVARPGPYPFKGRMTLLHAIALAGGTTKLSDAGHTQLTRRDVKDSKILVLVDFPAIRSGKNADVDIAPGDVIFVPETPL